MGDLGSIPGLGRSPGGGHDNPLQYSCLENPHEQRSLEGCSPWDLKEGDTTEGLRMHVNYTSVKLIFLKTNRNKIGMDSTFFMEFLWVIYEIMY